MPAKKQGNKQAKKQSNDMLAKAAALAIDQLKKPEVQEQIAKGGAAVFTAMKERSQRRAEERAAIEAEGGDPTTGASEKKQRRSVKETVTSPFGNQKMERRVQNLSENVTLLQGSVGPEAAEALGEIEAVVERLQVAVVMAANMPIVKRQKAHREIDSMLDDLERAVFAAVME